MKRLAVVTVSETCVELIITVKHSLSASYGQLSCAVGKGNNACIEIGDVPLCTLVLGGFCALDVVEKKLDGQCAEFRLRKLVKQMWNVSIVRIQRGELAEVTVKISPCSCEILVLHSKDDPVIEEDAKALLSGARGQNVKLKSCDWKQFNERPSIDVFQESDVRYCFLLADESDLGSLNFAILLRRMQELAPAAVFFLGCSSAPIARRLAERCPMFVCAGMSSQQHSLEVAVGQIQMVVAALSGASTFEPAWPIEYMSPLQTVLSAASMLCRETHRCHSSIELYNEWGSFRAMEWDTFFRNYPPGTHLDRLYIAPVSCEPAPLESLGDIFFRDYHWLRSLLLEFTAEIVSMECMRRLRKFLPTQQRRGQTQRRKTEWGELEQCLVISAALGKLDECQELLDRHKVDPDAANEEGFTPLMAAAACSTTYELLLQHSKKPGRKDILGRDASAYRGAVLRVYGERRKHLVHTQAESNIRPTHITTDNALQELAKVLCCLEDYRREDVISFLQEEIALFGNREYASKVCQADDDVWIAITNGTKALAARCDRDLLSTLLTVLSHLFLSTSGPSRIFDAKRIREAVCVWLSDELDMETSRSILRCLSLTVDGRYCMDAEMVSRIADFTRNYLRRAELERCPLDTMSVLLPVAQWLVNTHHDKNMDDTACCIIRLSAEWLRNRKHGERVTAAADPAVTRDSVLELCATCCSVIKENTLRQEALQPLMEWIVDDEVLRSIMGDYSVVEPLGVILAECDNQDLKEALLSRVENLDHFFYLQLRYSSNRVPESAGCDVEPETVNVAKLGNGVRFAKPIREVGIGIVRVESSSAYIGVTAISMADAGPSMVSTTTMCYPNPRGDSVLCCKHFLVGDRKDIYWAKDYATMQSCDKLGTVEKEAGIFVDACLVSVGRSIVKNLKLRVNGRALQIVHKDQPKCHCKAERAMNDGNNTFLVLSSRSGVQQLSAPLHFVWCFNSDATIPVLRVYTSILVEHADSGSLLCYESNKKKGYIVPVAMLVAKAVSELFVDFQLLCWIEEDLFDEKIQCCDDRPRWLIFCHYKILRKHVANIHWLCDWEVELKKLVSIISQIIRLRQRSARPLEALAGSVKTELLPALDKIESTGTTCACLIHNADTIQGHIKHVRELLENLAVALCSTPGSVPPHENHNSINVTTVRLDT